MTPPQDAPRDEVADWWATSIVRIAPNVIELRGVPIADVINEYGLPDIIWLLLRAERPSPVQARLLEAALVASVDHGPQAPSIAAARMAATCGVGLNNAMATGINLLGDVHGGAGQQCVEMLTDVVNLERDGHDTDDAALATVKKWRAGARHVPGFGHRFHAADPRRDPILALVASARDDGHIDGDYLRAGLAVEAALTTIAGKHIPMNVDAATAIVYAELGFPAPLARGLFVLSRSIGVLAHAWEETQSGQRLKGPIPPSIQPTYRSSAKGTGNQHAQDHQPHVD